MNRNELNEKNKIKTTWIKIKLLCHSYITNTCTLLGPLSLFIESFLHFHPFEITYYGHERQRVREKWSHGKIGVNHKAIENGDVSECRRMSSSAQTSIC